MILRILNFVVIGALVLAAAYVYRIKFDSTVQAERLAKLRGEVRRERDASRRCAPSGASSTIRRASRRWPSAICSSSRSRRRNSMRSITCPIGRRNSSARQHDPIGGMIENLDEPGSTTGSIAAPAEQCQRRAGADARSRSGSVNG